MTETPPPSPARRPPGRAWIAPPSVPLAFRDLAPGLADDLLARIDLATAEGAFGPFTARHAVERVRAAAVGFYPDHVLVEIQVAPSPASDDRPAVASFLYGPRGVVVLDGTSAPIHQTNAHRVALDDAAARLDYVRFFCAHVRGEDGPFRVVERPEDVDFRPRTRAATRARFAEHILDLHPIDLPDDAVTDPEAGGPPKGLLARLAARRHGFAATILYGDTLFRSVFALSSHGMIEMVEDEPLLKRLPIAADDHRSNYRIPARAGAADPGSRTP